MTTTLDVRTSTRTPDTTLTSMVCKGKNSKYDITKPIQIKKYIYDITIPIQMYCFQTTDPIINNPLSYHYEYFMEL